MDLLQQIKQASCYIKVESHHEFALALDYLFDNKVWFRSGISISRMPLPDPRPVFGGLYIVVEKQNDKPIIGLCGKLNILNELKYIDITNRFFDELIKTGDS